MKLKSIIATLLIIVLSIPMLPVREVGQLLSSNQMTEEIPHGTDTCKSFGKVFQFQEEVIEHEHGLSIFLGSQDVQYISFNIKLPAIHHGDIPTPPPNHSFA